MYKATAGKSANIYGIDNYLMQAIDSVEIDFTTEHENISNGDTVSVSIMYDNDILNASRMMFTGDTVSLNVNNLEEVEQIDPFEGLVVTFSGISPNGLLEYNYQGVDNRIASYSFYADQTDHLRNGDTVTIAIDSDDNLTGSDGYIYIKKSNEYTVEGLDEYISSYADIPQDFLDGMKSEAADIIYAYTARDYTNSVSLSSDLNYTGYMMNYVKDTGDYYSLGMNNVILIFSGIVSDTNGRFDATKVYYPVRFTNILKTRDGFSYEEKGSIIGWSTFDDSSTGTKGYVNPLQFYTDVIEENRDNYDSEVGDGFEIYQVPNQIAGLADINDDLRNKLYGRAMGIVTDYYMNHHYTGSSMDNLTVSGEYLLMFKNPGSDYKANNKYFVICSAYISCSAFEPATIYYPVEFDGIVSFSNG